MDFFITKAMDSSTESKSGRHPEILPLALALMGWRLDEAAR
jgi:hypothetical protein